jgi:hypothetical protein
MYCDDRNLKNWNISFEYLWFVGMYKSGALPDIKYYQMSKVNATITEHLE